MTHRQRKGREIVIRTLAAVLLLNAALHLTYYLRVGDDRLVGDIINFAITAILLCFVYRGSRFAFWLYVVLFAIGGIGALIAIPLTGWSVDIFGVFLALLAIVYLTSIVILMGSDSVDAFLRFQSEKPRPRATPRGTS